MDSGVREHPELVKQYFGTIIPANDNKFAALNSAVWSGGSFIYVPEGVKIDVPLQAYFRINAENMGQFERTLIIVRQGRLRALRRRLHRADLHAPNSLHSAVVEIIVQEGARCRYTTIQNWSKNVYNLVTKRAAAYKNATMEWVDGNLGSKLTMKYPAVWLMEEGARGEILSVAFASDGQHQDAGGKVVHVAPHTSSQIISKSISKGTGRSSYRGLVKVYKGAEDVRSNVVCDALLLDETSKTDTYPYIGDRGGAGLDRSRGDRLQGRRRADLLPAEPRPHRGRGDEHDRQRLHRADRQGASARIRGRAEPADPARDGRIRRVIGTSDERGAAALRSPRSLIGDRISMSTIAEVSDLQAQTQETGFSREGVEAISRARIETGASRDARLRAWELYESLPMPARTDEEWRRTDLRGLKLDRLRPARRCRRSWYRSPPGPGRGWRRGCGRADRARSQRRGHRAAGRLHDPDDARSGGRRQGRDLHRSRLRPYREHPELVERYFMTQAVQPSIGQVRGAARRLLAGRLVPLRAEGRHGRSAVPGVQPDLAARSSRLHPHPGRARGGRRGVRRRCLPLAVAGRAVVRLGRGRADRRAGRQAALRAGSGLGPRRLELHDRARDPRPATRR